MRAPSKRRILAALVAMAALAAITPTSAQPLTVRTLESAGETLHFSIHAFPAEAQRVDPATPTEPTSALNTAKLLNQYLLAGQIEDAALLSTAPRRRFEVLRDYWQSVGEDGFKQVYAQYFLPENRLVAEVNMSGHSLLVWHLKSNGHYAGQYFVQIEGKVLMDDTPSETRTRLSRVLEAIRTGKISVPSG